eukprot:3569429-Karenia_brevis.AAC.1
MSAPLSPESELVLPRSDLVAPHQRTCQTHEPTVKSLLSLHYPRAVKAPVVVGAEAVGEHGQLVEVASAKN